MQPHRDDADGARKGPILPTVSFEARRLDEGALTELIQERPAQDLVRGTEPKRWQPRSTILLIVGVAVLFWGLLFRLLF
jgi:hypothetical protein